MTFCNESLWLQLPVPYAKAGVNGGTAIPLPATVLVTRRCPPDKVRPLPPTPNQQTAIPLPATVLVTRRCPPDKVRPLPPTPNQQTGLHGGLQKHTLGAGGIGNSTPSDGNSCPGSPQHHNGTAIITQIPKGNNSLRLPQATNCKIPASPYSGSSTLQHHHQHHNNNNNNTITLIPNGNVTNIPATNNPSAQKHSMLDKFKLFNSKEKQDRAAQKSQISKRTSSSSGFSSARSERSDSSLSLDNGHHQGSVQPSSAIPGAKIKESGLKKLEGGVKSPSPAPGSTKPSSNTTAKLISSKSSSKDSSSAKAAAKAAAAAEKQRHRDAPPLEQSPPQTHIPLAPQKAQKIPMATTVTTTSLATGASAMAKPSPDPSSSSSRLKLAAVGGSRKLDVKSESKTSLQLIGAPKTTPMVPPQQQQQQ
uniref:Protein sickie n=1 Tax=Anopheles melas TaxID=34690 RepID=A0A182UI61_9DIPT